jgi:hypothetical protein
MKRQAAGLGNKLRGQLHFTRLRSMNGGNKRQPFVMGGAPVA